MITESSRHGQRAAIAAILFLASACGGGKYTSQAVWSQMEPAQRQGVRDILLKFQNGGVQNIDATRINGIIITEALRVFSDVDAGSVVISERELDLTASEVLPELDANGLFDPTGGYLSYNESVHDANGAVISDTNVHQRAKMFSSGSLDSFSRSLTTDSPAQGYVATTDNVAYSVASDTAYQRLAWNQQIARTDSFQETFSYHSIPMIDLTLAAGSSYASDQITEDQILSTEGFDTTTTTAKTWGLTGTYTLYVPKEVEPNQNAEAAPTSNTTTNGNIQTTSSDQTTVNEVTSFVGPASELEEKVTTHTTTTTETLLDTTVNCTTSDTTTTWTTVTHGFTIRDGMGLIEQQNRSLAQHPDYVETTKAVTTVTRTCQAGGSYDQTTTETVEKSTDNPATRNDVLQWRSTRHVSTASYDAGTGTLTTTDGGTEWLTDHIVEDPDVNAVAFELIGSDVTVTELHERYFGDNLEGVERNMTATRDLNVTYSWGSDTVTAAGTLVNRAASIDAPGPAAAEHTAAGDWDGTLSVTLGDAAFTVSAEEWNAAVQP